MEKDHTIVELSRFAVDFIKGAGDSALSLYGKGDKGKKFDENLVTEAELLLNDRFESGLHERFPEHQMFMNNQDEREYSHEENRYLWVFDALDGVANFQAGIPIWGMSIAVLENFWPVYGLFFMPATGDLFHAQAGKKAHWGDVEIDQSAFNDINNESLLFTYSRFHQHYRCSFPGKIRDLGCTGAHLCYAATGRAEGAIIANESYKGLAAAGLIIEAAGLKMRKMDGTGISLNEYLNGDKIDGHLLVSASETYRQIRQHLIEIR